MDNVLDNIPHVIRGYRGNIKFWPLRHGLRVYLLNPYLTIEYIMYVRIVRSKQKMGT